MAPGSAISVGGALSIIPRRSRSDVFTINSVSRKSGAVHLPLPGPPMICIRGFISCTKHV